VIGNQICHSNEWHSARATVFGVGRAVRDQLRGRISIAKLPRGPLAALAWKAYLQKIAMLCSGHVYSTQRPRMRIAWSDSIKHPYQETFQ